MGSSGLFASSEWVVDLVEDKNTAMSRSPWVIHQAFISGLGGDIRTDAPKADSIWAPHLLQFRDLRLLPGETCWSSCGNHPETVDPCT